MTMLGAYPEYKESGVAWLGPIPTGWDLRRLKSVVALQTDRADEQTNPVALENIEGWTGRFLPSDSEFSADGTRFRAGDVLFGKLRPYLAKSWLADCAGEAVGDFHVLRADPGLSPRFLQYITLSPEFISMVDGSTFGAKMPRVSWDFIGELRYPIPDRATQDRIARFLDRETAQIDDLIGKQERLIELLAEKRQAVIAQAVTKGLDPNAATKPSGVPWLGEVPASWNVSAIKHEWAVIDCKHITAEFVEDGFPLASIREVQGEFINLNSAKFTTHAFYRSMIEGNREPKAGDLIFSRNATVGEVAIVPSSHQQFAMGQDVCMLKRQDPAASPKFGWYALRSRYIQEQISLAMIGSTFKRINVEEIRSLRYCVPPTEEQHAIASYLDQHISRVDDLIDKAKSVVAILRERRSALISAAVTGKINVREGVM